MKTMKLLITLALLGTVGTGTAWADRGHWEHRGHGGRHGGGNVHFGVEVGPIWAPWYYPPAYYYPPTYYYPPYYPPLVVQPQQPQVYIEQPQMPAAPAESAAEASDYYWYYCTAAKGYYPYVKECPGGWQKVLPQPPDQP